MLPTKSPSHRRGPWPAATVAGLAIVLTGLAGCGGSDSARSKTTATRPPTARRAADLAVVGRIPMRSTINQVVAQVGPPARIERGRPASLKSKQPVGPTCYIYGVTGGRPTDQIRLCFIGGKLNSVLTLAATNPAPGSGAAPLPPAGG